jgi:glutamate-1-semialdehyde 2,1-aminomutase
MSDRSAELFLQAQKYLAGGVSRNTLLRSPHPYYVDRGEGCRLIDVDGDERIDFANNMASLIHGHAHPTIVEAMTAQLQKGTAFTMATEIEMEYARLLCDRSSGFDKIRFMNSGTEAIMTAVKATRAFTGRSRIAKVEGTYHGSYDYVEVSQAPAPESWGKAEQPTSVPLAAGTPTGVLSDVIVLPFNDPDAAVAILDEHRDNLACVLLDLMPHRLGLVPADVSFVKTLRKWTKSNGALLLFDEVITFRTEVGGMQERYDVQPDLTALGKIVGGGLPVGALAGREEVMEVWMARLRIDEAISVAGVPACVTGAGSLFRIHLRSQAPKDYRSSFPTSLEKKAIQLFVNGLYDEGIVLIHTGTGTLSTPMGEAEIDRLGEAVLASLRRVKERLREWGATEIPAATKR